MLDTEDKRAVRKGRITHTTHDFCRAIGSSSLSTKTKPDPDTGRSPELPKYKFDDAKLGPVVDAHAMAVASSSSFIDMKGSPSPQKMKGLKSPLSKTVAKILPHSRTNSSESSSGAVSGRPSTDSTWEFVEPSLDLEAVPSLSHSKPPHISPSPKAVGKKWIGLGGKSHDKLTTSKIGIPHLKEDTRPNDRLQQEDTFYPYHPLGRNGERGGSLHGSTPSLDTQNASATESSPATSFIDMSDDGHSVYGHKRSESTDSVRKKWRAKLAGRKNEEKVDEFGFNPEGGLQRSGGLVSELGGKAHPRPLDHGQSDRPSLEYTSPRHAYDIFPHDPFARPPPPSANLEPTLSPEDRAKVDANYASVPAGYEERMNRAPRPKGRTNGTDPLGPYNVSEPGSVTLPPHVREQLEREALSARLKPERDRKVEKEPAKLAKERKVTKKESRAKEQGHKDLPIVPVNTNHHPSSSVANKLQKKAPGTDAKLSVPPQAKAPAHRKASKNIPPPLSLHHDNFAASSSSLSVNDTIVLKPFSPSPARPLTPEEGVEGAMCLTMDDFELESEAEKPPPLPPKDRGKLSKSNSSSSKSTVKASRTRQPSRRPETLATVMSVYSQPSFCEDGEIDLIITPRRPSGRT